MLKVLKRGNLTSLFPVLGRHEDPLDLLVEGGTQVPLLATVRDRYLTRHLYLKLSGAVVTALPGLIFRLH